MIKTPSSIESSSSLSSSNQKQTQTNRHNDDTQTHTQRTEPNPNPKIPNKPALTPTQVQLRHILRRNEQTPLRLRLPLYALDQHHLVRALPRVFFAVQREPSHTGAAVEFLRGHVGESRYGWSR